MKILLQGASGRMGQQILRSGEERGHEIFPLPRGKVFAGESVDVLIDFSRPAGTAAAAAVALHQRIPLVSGTTDLGGEVLSLLRAAAEKIPVVHAPNFALGMGLFRKILRQLAASLPEEFAIEIVETHHRHKKDMPSGTAKNLAEIMESARVATRGKSRPIGMHSLRGGDVFGEHEVRFLGEGETLRLSHGALHRGVFAAGALHVAEIFVRDRFPPKFYELEDIFS
ncbi:MAG: 4-hydroxy-tetrahydrodipicolinate reductase [Puniceicoccales bacterium]|nr:4-hydroxy-tetrahydrodipicolinate reductase [Puniceicoccales bacterium]